VIAKMQTLLSRHHLVTTNTPSYNLETLRCRGFDSEAGKTFGIRNSIRERTPNVEQREPMERPSVSHRSFGIRNYYRELRTPNGADLAPELQHVIFVLYFQQLTNIM
jgi:hypothetical protein